MTDFSSIRKNLNQTRQQNVRKMLDKWHLSVPLQHLSVILIPVPAFASFHIFPEGKKLADATSATKKKVSKKINKSDLATPNKKESEEQYPNLEPVIEEKNIIEKKKPQPKEVVNKAKSVSETTSIQDAKESIFSDSSKKIVTNKKSDKTTKPSAVEDEDAPVDFRKHMLDLIKRKKKEKNFKKQEFLINIQKLKNKALKNELKTTITERIRYNIAETSRNLLDLEASAYAKSLQQYLAKRHKYLWEEFVAGTRSKRKRSRVVARIKREAGKKRRISESALKIGKYFRQIHQNRQDVDSQSKSA